ncbi:MAG: terminase family protein, partial [Anaerolineae bacterium]|nr:terminase family protein [Anaerolineae bacterium]
MPEITVQLFSLLPRQHEIISHPSRFRVLACGRRFGKTETAIHEMSVRALRGERVAYFAPTYKMTSETFRHLLDRLSPVITYSSKTDSRIQLITGGVIECWSLSTTSAESVRGRKYHFAVIDEAAMVVNGMKIWQEVIRPLLVDYRGGAFFCSTPKGMNWFYQLYQW